MDDLGFVQRCVKGDSGAWNEFVEKYSRLIYNYIHKILNANGRAIAQPEVEDIFQGIFTALIKDNFKKLNSFKAKNGCSLASWLRQVTINFTIDHLRKLKPAVSLEAQGEDEVGLKDFLVDDSATVTDTIVAKERVRQLKDCIKKLDTDEKFFLELHLNRGLNLEVIRRTLRISRGAVDMRKLRIVERLRECFKKKGALLDF